MLAGVLRVIGADGAGGKLENFDVPGALLVTGGMLLLVYALVEAPSAGWGSASASRALQLAGSPAASTI